MTKNRSVALVATLAAALVAAAAPAATAGTTRSVTVGDNFFSPSKLTVAPKTKIVWKWQSGNSESHDVYLSRMPKRVKRFQSEPAASDFRYSQKLTVPGTYKVLCTFHEGMTQTITVKKK
jgi:plastocyanin